MPGTDFLSELEELKNERLRAMTTAGAASLGSGGADSGEAGGQVRLLQIALANEISVSELAAAWMPSTPEVDIKIALARQAGGEARPFQLPGGSPRNPGVRVSSF